MKYLLEFIVKESGLCKHVTWHTARHTYATEICLTNGVPIESLAALNEFYESRRNELLEMFKGLKKLREDSLYCESYGYPEETVFRYMDLIQKMGALVG